MVQLYKKIVLVAFSIFLMGIGVALSAETKAKRIRTTTAPFGNFLSVTDTNVQTALETLNTMNGSFNLTTTGTLTSGSLLIDDPTFFIDGGNNYIGIGTTATNIDNQIHILMTATKDILIDGSTNPREIDTGVMRWEHKPAIDNTRCLTMNIDNENREDTHGFVINFDADRMNESASMYDANIDTTNATAGNIAGYEISQVGSVISVHALHVNPGINPIHQNSGAFGNVEKAFDEDGGFTDTTTAFNSAGTDVELFTGNGDKMYIGMAAVFNSIEVILATDASGAGIKPTFSVSNGSGGWITFIPTDNTRGFRGSGVISWETNPGSWAQDEVNSISGKYWFRIIRTNGGAMTAPIEDTIQVQDVAEYEWDENGVVTISGLVVDTNTLYVDSGNNRVGIGTTAPWTKLHATGAILVSGTAANPAFGTGAISMRYDGSENLIETWASTNLGIETAGVRRMTILSTGNVGIGTTSPATQGKLHVQGSVAYGGTQVSASADRPTIYINGEYPNLIIGSAGNFNHGSTIGLWSWDESTTTHQWNIGGGQSGNFSIGYATNDPNPHASINGYAPGNTYIQILPSGNVGIGRVPTTNDLEVEGTASKTASGDWLANSDIRIKTDVHDLENALEIISRLHPVRFRYTDEYRAGHPSIENIYHYNFIAQEFQELFPGSVKGSGEYLQGDDQEILQMDTYNVRPYLVAALQELSKVVEELKVENEALKARIEVVEATQAQNYR